VSIVIREIDTGSDPALARAGVGTAIKNQNTPILVGSILSSETREFLKPVLDEHVVVIANGSSDPSIRELPFRHKGDGFFRNWPADDFEGRAMAEYLRISGRGDTLAVLYADDPYPRALAEAFVARFRELGGTVAATITYPKELTHFDELVQRGAQKGVNGFYVVGFPADLAGIYNSLRRTPTTRTLPMYSAVGVESGDFANIARKPLTQLFYTAPAVDESSQPYLDFRQRYAGRFKNEAPDIVAAITYDALWIAVDAARASQCQSERVKQYVRNVHYDGASGLTAFDSLGDVITKPVAIKYYENGLQRIAIQSKTGAQ
jgi:branched-chain amino acid transport system substrate-binding protein